MSHLSLTDGSTGFHFAMCGTTHPNRSYSIHRPASTVSCLETVRSGNGTVILNGHEQHLCAGDSYLLLEGNDHRYYADRSTPWEKVWVNFSGAFSLSLLRLFGLNSGRVFRGIDLSDLLLKLQELATDHDIRHAAEQCTGVMTQAFTRLSAASRSQLTPNSPAQELRLYIDRHITEPLRVEELAKQIGRSASQAQRLFGAEVGVSLYHYVLDKKLTLACQLLRETGMSVREIAAYLSFEDEFYFSGLFRRKVGVSPSGYREQTR